jgi:hypothetical protein
MQHNVIPTRGSSEQYVLPRVLSRTLPNTLPNSEFGRVFGSAQSGAGFYLLVTMFAHS